MSKAKRASRGDGGPLRITTTNDEVSDTPSKIAKQAFNWRAHLAVHPAAEAFPLLPKKELKELAGDIKHNDRQTGIVLSFSEAGAKKQLLDGRNRLDALAMFGLLQVDDLGRFYVKKQDGGLEQIEEQHIVVGDAEKHAYSLNLHRRHFTREQKRELIARLLKENPEASGRQISKQIKADNKTLAAVRSDLERREELPHVDIRTDTKGRQQPATKVKPTVSLDGDEVDDEAVTGDDDRARQTWLRSLRHRSALARHLPKSARRRFGDWSLLTEATT